MKVLCMIIALLLCVSCGVSETETDINLGFRRDAGELDALTELNLAYLDISDAGLVHLEGLDKLQVLWLDGTAISDSGLRRIAGLSNLTHLGLQDTAVSGSGLARLKDLKKLRRLWLGGTRVSASAVQELKDLDLLMWLDIRGLDFTAEQLEAVQSAFGASAFVYHEKLRPEQTTVSLETFMENPFDFPLIKASYASYTVESTPVFPGEPIKLGTRQWPSRQHSQSMDTVYTLSYPDLELVIYHSLRAKSQRIINITVSGRRYPLIGIEGPGMTREDVLEVFATPDEVSENLLVYKRGRDGDISFHIKNDVVTRIVFAKPSE